MAPELRSASPSGRLRMLVFIAWRNVWRNPVRSALTVSALAGGLVMVILYTALLEGMTRQMQRFATEISTGHIQLHRQAYIDDRDLYATLPWSYLEGIERHAPEVTVAPRLYAAGLASAGDVSVGVLIEAVDPRREPRVTQMLGHVRRGVLDLALAGSGEQGLQRINVVVGAQLARNLQVEPGSELVLVTQAADGSIGNALYRVSAVLKPLEPNFDRSGVLMSIAAYRQLMVLDSGFHELAIRIGDGSRLLQTQADLSQLLAKLTVDEPLDALGGAPVLRNWRELAPAVADMLELSKSMNLIIGLIVISLASLGVLNTMLMAVHERTHEFGILLAIGMKRRWLLLTVLLESFFLALVSALAGSLLGVLVGGYFEQHGIDFSASMPDGYDWAGMVFEPVMKGHLDPSQVVVACVLMVVVTLLAALIPSWRAVRLKPAEVMR